MGPQHTRCGKCGLDCFNKFDEKASMGPQHTRCGKRFLVPRFPLLANCFNGAATYSLRKGRLEYATLKTASELQWGRNILVAERPATRSVRTAGGSGFNGAATYSLRKARTPDSFPPRTGGFNGAATYSLRKVGRSHVLPAVGAVASMGPQHTRCGKLSTSLSLRSPCRSFNGAATYSLRKARGPRGLAGDCRRLQWGRNILVAERMARPASSIGKKWASMGPQHTRCGKPCPPPCPCVQRRRFNGAATYSLRKEIHMFLMCPP